jgi:hypothetical protein
MKKLTRRASRKDQVVVALKKMPPEGKLPAQAFAICGCLRKRALSVGDLKREMAKKIESVQTMSRLWIFYRSTLLKSGSITLVKNAKKGASR